jgi:glycosyltransferase involved in cell wall biosynthesis
MKIGIHITAYNRRLFTEQCLKSLFWSDPKYSCVVIVDNNSVDGTKELLTEYQSKCSIIRNSANIGLGAAVNQGWTLLRDEYKCNILGWINNDFLFEPGWEQNVISCFEELNLGYIVGTVRPDREKEKHATPSGKGFYTTANDVGAAYFLRTKYFNGGVTPSSQPFVKNYTGPGPSFHSLLQKNNLKGVRLAHPGILVRDSEYTNPLYKKYYDETFGSRNLSEKLGKFRKQEAAGNPRGWTNWKKFKEKYHSIRKEND